MVVVDRVVLGAAIVPKGERTPFPAEAAGEFRALLMGEQILQQRRALRLTHVLEAHRVTGIDVERLAVGSRVGAHDRVLSDVPALRVGPGTVANPVLARL